VSAFLGDSRSSGLHNLLFPNVAIWAILNEGHDVALVASVAAFVSDVLAASRRLVEVSRRIFDFVLFDHFHATIFPNRSHQIHPAVWVRLVRYFQHVSVVHFHHRTRGGHDQCRKNHKNRHESHKLSRNHFISRFRNSPQMLLIGWTQRTDNTIQSGLKIARVLLHNSLLRSFWAEQPVWVRSM
jgi:hypothetical protein